MRLASSAAVEPAGSDDEERMVVDEGPMGMFPGDEASLVYYFLRCVLYELLDLIYESLYDILVK